MAREIKWKSEINKEIMNIYSMTAIFMTLFVAFFDL